MEEANQDKRLMQKTAFGSSDSPTTSRGLWRAEKAGRTTKKPRGPEPVTPFVRKGGTGRGAVLSILLWDARGVTLTGPSSLWAIPHPNWQAQVPGWFHVPLDPPSLLQRAFFDVAGKKTEFPVDTGDTSSVLTWPAKGKVIYVSPLPATSGPLLLLTPFCTCQNAQSSSSGEICYIILGQDEVQGDKESKQRMCMWATPDDPPGGHQNIPHNIL